LRSRGLPPARSLNETEQDRAGTDGERDGKRDRDRAFDNNRNLAAPLADGTFANANRQRRHGRHHGKTLAAFEPGSS
jgi:hypothetical protein